MDFVQGVIEQIYTKEIPADRFQNTWRRALKINGTFFGVGAGKKPVVSVKQGQEWIDLREGMTVKFMVKERVGGDGKTYYDKEGNITIVKGADGKVQEVASAPSTSRTNTAPVAVKYNGDKGVRVGHAITNAVNICIAKATIHGTVTNLNISEIEDHAWAVLSLSEKMVSEFDTKMSAVSEKAVESKPETQKASITRTAVGKISGSRVTSQSASVSSEDDDFPEDSPF